MTLRRSNRFTGPPNNATGIIIDEDFDYEEDIYTDSEVSSDDSVISDDSFIVNNDEAEIIMMVGDDSEDDEDYQEVKPKQNAQRKLYEAFLLKDLPQEIRELYIKKLEQLDEMTTQHGEYFKLKRWLDGFISIPFGEYQKLPFETMDFAEKTTFIHSVKDKLDNVIYGHQSTKDEIVCMMVKWMVNPDANGNIIALHGSAGTGKTELIKNGLGPILERSVHHISLGGMSDGSYLDGHEFTYEGSMWGRIVDILMHSKCMNPIFFFDELDKVSETQSGREIIGKLIHLTDHTQNNNFMDKYFQGIPIDISKAIFIFSFNDIEYVDKILLDRIKVIKMDSFNSSDKLNIARDFLLPKVFLENKMENVVLTDECIKHIIGKCGHSGGVRDIKRYLEEIVMKLNVLKFIPNKKINVSFDKSVVITPEIADKLVKNITEISISAQHMYI